MLFKKVYCRLPFSANDPGNGYLFTSLLGLQHTSWQTPLSSRVYRNPKYSGTIPGVVGLVVLMERHARIEGITLLCMHWMYHGNQVRSCRPKYLLWALENWNLEWCLWSDFRLWPSSFHGSDCTCWNQYRFDHCLCTYFLKLVLKHWNHILASASLCMSLPWQVLLIF